MFEYLQKKVIQTLYVLGWKGTINAPAVPWKRTADDLIFDTPGQDFQRALFVVEAPPIPWADPNRSTYQQQLAVATSQEDVGFYPRSKADLVRAPRPNEAWLGSSGRLPPKA